MKSHLKKETAEHREAKAILRPKVVEVKQYHPRFDMRKLSKEERFKCYLFFNLRTAYREYIDYCSWYEKEKKLLAIDFIMPDIKQSVSACKKPQGYIDTIEAIIIRYDLGEYGKRGTFNPCLSLDMYNEIISKLEI